MRKNPIGWSLWALLLPLSALSGSPTPTAEGLTGVAALQSPRSAEALNFNARVLGQVTVSLAGKVILISGARIFLRDSAGAALASATATSGSDGHFEIPPQAPGRYQICAEAPGLVPACAGEPVLFDATSDYAIRDFKLAVQGRAVLGRVLLGDGRPCYHPSRSFDSEVLATVKLDGTALQVQANQSGEYVLGGLPKASALLRATCQAGEERQTLPALGPEVRDQLQALDFRIATASPSVRWIALRRSNGQGARSGKPGETLHAEVRAYASDRLPLSYRWAVNGGRLASVDGPKASWRLPPTNAQALITVEISNGRGGFAEAQLELPVAATSTDRLMGRIVDQAGRALPELSLSIDGQRLQTDDDGRFRIELPESERHVVSIHKPGYALLSQVFRGPNSEINLVLQTAKGTRVNPAERIQVTDALSRTRIEIPANSLVDTRGRQAGGPLLVYVSAYDPNHREDMPGDGRVTDAKSNDFAAQINSSISVDIVDGRGQPYQLARGKLARIAIPAPPLPPGIHNSGPSLSLLHFDERSGSWTLAGEMRRSGDAYIANVPSFSTWAGGSVNQKWACVALTIAPELLGQVKVRSTTEYQADQSKPLTGPSVKEFTPTHSINAITHLPEFKAFYIQLVPLDDPQHVLAREFLLTQNAVVKLPLEYPYTDLQHGCNAFVNFSRFDVLPSNSWLNKYVGNDAQANSYYQLIGAKPAKNTYAKFKTANNITAADLDSAVNFYNAQELGLGRKTYCRQNGSDPDSATLACCVTKFGHAGGPVQEALQDTIQSHAPGDTVCMEYAPPVSGGGERFTKFYVYNPEGALQNYTYFDPSGPKFVPQVCMHCHGRTKDWQAHGGDMGGKFVFLDVPSYKFRDYSGAHSRDGQQERFRKLNQMVLMTHNGTGPYADFINSLYPDGVANLGSKAQTPATLAGWNTWPDVFKDIVKPNCRTCHLWQGVVDFKKRDADIGAIVQSRICSGVMPNAYNPTLNLWKVIDPFLGNLLLAAYNQPPCYSNNQKPSVQITAPTDGSQVNFGQIFGTSFKATSSDTEDGSSCCAITWVSDKDGLLGYGDEIMFSFSTPGVRKVSAIATDSDYGVAKASITITLKNEPPSVRFVQPTVDNQSFFKGVPYLLEAQASDPNAPSGLDCSGIGWVSSKAGDPFPQSGCFPETLFTSNGSRTLTVKATDPQGATNSKSRVVNVPDPPLNSPPIVTILAPHPDQYFNDASVTTQVRGSAVDPDNSGQVTVVWRLGDQANSKIISNQLVFNWKPSTDVPFSCGGGREKLCLYASDPDGTGQACVDIYIYYPVC